MPFRKPIKKPRPSRPKDLGWRGVNHWIGTRPFLLRWAIRLGGVAFLLLMVGIVAFELWFGSQARSFDMKALSRMPERSVVLDQQGGELGRLHGENRTAVAYEKISPYFRDALLAREDDRFQNHGGVDLRGVARAVLRNYQDQGKSQGASTLTMQLARNAFGLGRQKTYGRKFLEIALAQRIEAKFSKQEILTFYCNQVYLGQALHGIEAGAQAYFRKSAAQLDLGEAALLAGIIRGPNSLSPWKNLKVALQARDTVLDRMVASGRLDAAAATLAKARPTHVYPLPKARRQETWALDAVRRVLETVLDSEDVEAGGLKIYTTLQPALQSTAEAALERRLAAVESTPGYPHQTRASFHQAWASGKLAENTEPDYLQGATVLLENRTGAIRAIVGGRDYRHSTFNRAVSAHRQAGSTLKPLVYAAAVNQGLFPGQLINDDPLEPRELRELDARFSPENSDGTFTGLQTAAFGLAKSRNTMAVRIGEMAGVENVKTLLHQAGLGQAESSSAQLFLGNLGVELQALTSALSIFANDGNRCRPYLIDRIEDPAGEVIFRSGKMEYSVVSPGTAWTVNAMLQQVMQPGGTGDSIAEFKLNGPLCGKTGTTDGYKDAWFVGSTPDLTCGVWIGLDDNSRIIGKGYGSRLALPVWGDLMRKAEQSGYNAPGSQFPQPALVNTVLCPITGNLAKTECRGVSARIPQESLPSTWCPAHRGEIQPQHATPGLSQAPSPSGWNWLRRLFQ